MPSSLGPKRRSGCGNWKPLIVTGLGSTLTPAFAKYSDWLYPRCLHCSVIFRKRIVGSLGENWIIAWSPAGGRRDCTYRWVFAWIKTFRVYFTPCRVALSDTQIWYGQLTSRRERSIGSGLPDRNIFSTTTPHTELVSFDSLSMNFPEMILREFRETPYLLNVISYLDSCSTTLSSSLIYFDECFTSDFWYHCLYRLGSSRSLSRYPNICFEPSQKRL